MAGTHAAFPHQMGAKSGGGGFTVCAGDDYAFFPVQDGCQTFRPAHAGNIELARGGQRRIVFPDGAGIDDDFRVRHGVRRVRAGESQPQALQTFRFRAGYAVAAADPVPHFHEHESQAGHAGPRHSDEVKARRGLPVDEAFVQGFNHGWLESPCFQ